MGQDLTRCSNDNVTFPIPTNALCDLRAICTTMAMESCIQKHPLLLITLYQEMVAVGFFFQFVWPFIIHPL